MESTSASTSTSASAMLCYIDSGVAYFTTQKLEDQWGDDWNDASYEHNAELPYEDEKKYRIFRLRFISDLLEPKDDSWPSGSGNSRFSVESINQKKVPWLRSAEYVSRKKKIEIWAGTTFSDFQDLIKKSGGSCKPEIEENESDDELP